MFVFVLISVVKFRPWQISVAGFWISAMANFVKDGGAILGYVIATCRLVWQDFGSPPWSAIHRRQHWFSNLFHIFSTVSQVYNFL
jgi:hypothetical protein